MSYLHHQLLSKPNPNPDRSVFLFCFCHLFNRFTTDEMSTDRGRRSIQIEFVLEIKYDNFASYFINASGFDIYASQVWLKLKVMVFG